MKLLNRRSTVSSADIRSVIDQVQAIEVKDIVRELEASHPEWNVPERKVRKVLRERSLMKNDSQSLGADDASLLSETSDASYFQRKSLKFRSSMKSSMRRLSSRRSSSKRDDMSLGAIAESKAIDDSASPITEAPVGLAGQLHSPISDEAESIISELTDRSAMSSNRNSVGSSKRKNPLKKLMSRRSIFKDPKDKVPTTTPHEHSPTSVAHLVFNRGEPDDMLLFDPNFPHSPNDIHEGGDEGSLRSTKSVEETVYYDCEIPHSVSKVDNEDIVAKAADLPKADNTGTDAPTERMDGEKENCHFSVAREDKNDVEEDSSLEEANSKYSDESHTDHIAACDGENVSLKDKAAISEESEKDKGEYLFTISEDTDANEMLEECIISGSKENGKIKPNACSDEVDNLNPEECFVPDNGEFKPIEEKVNVLGGKMEIISESPAEHYDVSALPCDENTTAATPTRKKDMIGETEGASNEEQQVIEVVKKDTVKDIATISIKNSIKAGENIDDSGEGKEKQALIEDGEKDTVTDSGIIARENIVPSSIKQECDVKDTNLSGNENLEASTFYKDDNDGNKSGETCFNIVNWFKSLHVSQKYEDIETSDDCSVSIGSKQNVNLLNDTKSSKLYEDEVNDPKTGKACFAIVYGCIP